MFWSKEKKRSPASRWIKQASFGVEVMEPRWLMSATLTSTASSITDIETGGPFSTSYASVSGSKQNSFYASLEVYEFNPGSAIFPTSYKVSDISNINLTQYNTAISGAYGGTAGTFDVYLIPNSDTTTPTSSLRFQDTATGGYSDSDGLNGQGGVTSADLVGQITFTNASVGYGSSTFTANTNGTSSSSAAEQAMVADLNSGTSFRLAVTPTTETVAADYDGNYNSSVNPQLSLTVDQAPTVVENFNFSPSSYTVNENAGTVTATVTRDGSTADTANVQFSTADSNALAGTNYTASNGTLNFAIGQSSATFNVPITDLVNQGGNKVFNLSLSNPSTAGVGFAHDIGQFSTANVTIVDSQNNAGNTQTLTEYSYDNGTIEKTGSYQTTYFNVAGSGAAYPSFGALDFNGTPTFEDAGGVAPSGAPSGAYVFAPTNAVTAINGITLNLTQAYPDDSTSGPINAYLVSDTSDSIDPGLSPFAYDSTTQDGINGQLGTQQLLGTFNWSSSNPTDVFSSESLTSFNPAAESALISDINSGTQFRIVLGAESASTNMSLEGQYGYNGTYEAPQLSFNVTEATAQTGVAPTVASTVIGTGAVQRSSFGTISVTFNAPVTLGSGAYTLYQEVLNSDGSINTSAPAVNVTSGVTSSLSSDGKTLTLSVAPGGVIDRGGGFFANGIYQLVLNGSAITDAATGTAQLNGGASMPVSFASNEAAGGTSLYFHSLFGDVNGDGAVNLTDDRAFARAYGSSTGDSNFDSTFDFNGDGSINLTDDRAFLKDYSTSFSY